MGKVTTTLHGQHVMFYIIRSQLAFLRRSTAIVSSRDILSCVDKCLHMASLMEQIYLFIDTQIHDVHKQKMFMYPQTYYTDTYTGGASSSQNTVAVHRPTPLDVGMVAVLLTAR